MKVMILAIYGTNQLKKELFMSEQRLVSDKCVQVEQFSLCVLQNIPNWPQNSTLMENEFALRSTRNDMFHNQNRRRK